MKFRNKRREFRIRFKYCGGKNRRIATGKICKMKQGKSQISKGTQKIPEETGGTGQEDES